MPCSVLHSTFYGRNIPVKNRKELSQTAHEHTQNTSILYRKICKISHDINKGVRRKYHSQCCVNMKHKFLTCDFNHKLDLHQLFFFNLK
jgi:hypothetical protein